MRAVLTLLLVLVTLPAPVRAPGSAGRIVFVASRTADGNADIFSTDLASETIVDLTNDPAPDRSPSWSPDGTRIVFASRRDNSWDVIDLHSRPYGGTCNCCVVSATSGRALSGLTSG